MADCLNNEEQVNSNLSCENIDSLNSVLDVDSSVLSDMSLVDSLSGETKSMQNTTSNLSPEGDVESKLDLPTTFTYSGSSSETILVSVDNDNHTISADLKPIMYNSTSEFPTIGSEKLIYIDRSTRNLYAFNSRNQKYYKVASEENVKPVYTGLCGSEFSMNTSGITVVKIENFPYTKFDDIPNGTTIEITFLNPYVDVWSEFPMYLELNDMSAIRVLVTEGKTDGYYNPATMGGWKANDVLTFVKGRSWMLTMISGKLMNGVVQNANYAQRAYKDSEGNTISLYYAKETDVSAIRQQYLKSATISDNVLTITNQSGSKIEFKGGSSGGGSTVADAELSETSTNAVQNKVVTEALAEKLSLAGGTMTGQLKFEGMTDKSISVENSSGDCMMKFTRTDTGNAISFGVGSGGQTRGMWDEKLGYWLVHCDGSKLKFKGQTTRPTYNDNDMALYSDVTNLGRFVNVALTSGTRYYPLVRFNKAISDGNNYSAVFLNGRIGGWGSSAVAYINAVFWGRDARGGEYNSLGNIKGALERADFVMYEESSTSVVLYLKINGYSLARFSFSGSGEGVANLYDGSYITSTPTGTLIASMTNGKISEKKDAELLYDMSSSSSSINWGKTGGIKAGEKVSGKDFSKYSFLRVTCNSYDTKMTYYVDLKKQVLTVEATGYTYVGSTQGQHMDNLLEQCTSMSGVNTAKTEFYYMTAGYINGSTWNERKNNSSYIVTKIEGVI